MKGYLYLILLIVPALTIPAQGGIFSKKAAKPNNVNADQRLPELLFIVKSDPDEAKRTSAAAELRDYDPNTYTDIIPVLVDVLKNDSKPGVRREAANSLGRLRAKSPDASKALQQAASKDASWRVRFQAWSSLKMSQISGLTSHSKEPQPSSKAPAVHNNSEPPAGNSQKIIIIDEKGNPTSRIETPSVNTQQTSFTAPLPQTQWGPRAGSRPAATTITEDGPAMPAAK